MARPENRSEARPLNLTLPEETFNYLVLLATLGKLGRTENEVATHILVREAYAMYERGFHAQQIPSADQTWKREHRRYALGSYEFRLSSSSSRCASANACGSTRSPCRS